VAVFLGDLQRTFKISYIVLDFQHILPRVTLVDEDIWAHR